LVMISSGKLDDSKHYDHLSYVLRQNAKVLVPRARRILIAILHDYSHFSIGTIDEFFQNILRSFTRELGIYSGYKVELNAKKVILQAIDRLVSKSDHDPDLFNWMLSGITEKVEEGKAWRRFEVDLLNLGYELLREQLAVMTVNPESNTFSAKKIKQFRTNLTKLENRYLEKVEIISQDAREALMEAGLDVADFTGKKSGPAGYLINLQGGNYDPKKRRRFLNNPDAWVAKKTPEDIRTRAVSLADSVLNSLLQKAIDLYDHDYPDVLVATKIRQKLLALGLASILGKEIIELGQEQSSFLLSFTNPVIAALIKDNPSPFIYERTGRFYKNFMIDEFQDTSDLQWSNFLPLISDSLAEGGLSLVVGDAKQSIYRWRNSNWQLMASQAEQDLKTYGVKSYPLKYNYRSRQSVVDFNNHLFSKAGDLVRNNLASQLESQEKIAATSLDAFYEVYKDVKQDFGSKRTGGFVKASFCNNELADGFPSHFAEIFDLIEDLQIKHKYEPKDIVFLVRTKKEGTQLIRYFTSRQDDGSEKSGCKYSIVSGESLRLDSAAVLRCIMAFFPLIDSPNDKSLLGRFALEFLTHRGKTISSSEYVLLTSLHNPESLKTLGLSNLPKLLRSAVDLNIPEAIELVIRELELGRSSAAVSFIIAFKDSFYSQFGYNSLCNKNELLEWWKETGGQEMLSMDENVNAMKVMTIHKAKGLEFPVVILPACDWSMDYSSTKRPDLWVETKDTIFNELPIVPIAYSKDLLPGSFAKDYINENVQIHLDNLNLLYVALTRASDHLHLFVPKSSKSGLSRIGGILEEIIKPDSETGIYTFGDEETCSDFPIGIDNVSMTFKSYPAWVDSTDDAKAEYGSASIERGNVIHKIFELVVTIEDVSEAVKSLINDGFIDVESGASYEEKVRGLIQMDELQEYFSGEGRVLCEKSLLIPEKGELRPDRVVLFGKRAAVLDYKTGKVESHHKSQVRKYINALKNMGYSPVDGYLVYFDEAEIIQV
ncbi:MAG: UvrD-helicase domain-containing protein, partial [Bacteroidales bacterium]|nr:UvrD-helicase domain-containing protein [Bacteroidales bacterium]